jgi:hypothetical protein
MFRYKENFLKNILQESLEKNIIEITVQDFVSKLFSLEPRPQKDICHDIKKREEGKFIYTL